MSCVKEITLPVERDDAWEAVTDPEALEAWLAERVEIDLRPGGEASFVLPGGERRDGVVEEVAPGERLAFWWWPAPADGETVPPEPGSRVTFELAPAVGGTRVRVTETPAGPTATAAAPVARLRAGAPA
jgi:uncharacterized protein YndB with AHSA1/START domain